MAESRFDRWVAERYHDLWPELFEPRIVEPTVDFLSDLADGGPVLEFGIGTGRIALALSRERWSSWHRESFTSESRNHISVWELPG